MRLRLTKKEKEYLFRMLSKSHALAALDIYYSDNDAQAFYDAHGMTMRDAEKALEKLLDTLGSS